MSTIDVLTAKVRISDYIGQFVKLRASNRAEKVGLCPFHNEKTPSFNVNDEKAVFYCFACGAGGNIITFASKYHKVSAGEAVKMLAKQYNIPLSTTQSATKFNNLYDIHDTITNFYHENLRKSKVALEYLKERGLNDEVIDKYKLGYSSGDIDELLDRVKSQNLSQYIDDTKIIHTYNGKKVDFFSKRIIFPIMDTRGRTIGWGGRTMSTSHQPKYLNSRETELFKKSDSMYGMHHALRALDVKASDFSSKIIIVEGYMDVLKLASKGIYTGIAVLGTAINVEHVVKVCNITKSYPIICMDNDEAGKKAALRLAYSLVKVMSKDVTAAFFSAGFGKDLDEFLHTKTSSELLTEINSNTVSVLDLIFDDICSTVHAPSKPERFAMIDSKIVEVTQNISQLNFRKDCIYYLREKLWHLKREKKNTEDLPKSTIISNKIQKPFFHEAIVMDLLAFLSHNLHYLNDERVLSVLEELQISDEKLQKISEAMIAYGEQYQSVCNTHEMKEVHALLTERLKHLREFDIDTLLGYFAPNEWRQKKEEYDKIDSSQPISDTVLDIVEDFVEYNYKLTFSNANSYAKNIAILKKRTDKF
ncbi:DNA primase [Candidatus Fokinia solitaria]|uniref:DNA primase n=1 Tax=Candidatus Fokinia solitaria TaxID=1802984 RepID=A0A2U8BS66_9RICK|nr:DNA primase [Candidatus Fokinia solitaria]AWD33189.1 DNA primase [Candidatus Fokinia solitaria]